MTFIELYSEFFKTCKEAKRLDNEWFSLSRNQGVWEMRHSMFDNSGHERSIEYFPMIEHSRSELLDLIKNHRRKCQAITQSVQETPVIQI